MKNFGITEVGVEVIRGITKVGVEVIR